MVAQQSVCLRKLGNGRAGEVRFGRFLANRRVSASGLVQDVCAGVGERSAGRHVLAIQDTSEINYQAHAGRVCGLGTVGNGADLGFSLHPVLVVADEFLPEFASVDERNLALVRHHSAYLLASMAWVGEPPASEGGLDLKLYRDLRRSIIMAMVAATEGKTNQAVSLCRNLYARLCESGLRERPAHEIGAFVRFYWLGLQAMVAGFDYEVERKTFPRRFAGLAALAGLELRRHRRVFATTGSDDWGGGTHVFTFSKPEGA